MIVGMTKALKVLVAEDDVFLASLLIRALQTEHFDAQAVYDGVQAIEKIKIWQPDFLLLDIFMPNKDGFEVLEDIKSTPTPPPAVKVIVLSNLNETENIERAKKLNVLDYLIKANTTPHEVVDRLKTFLN